MKTPFLSTEIGHLYKKSCVHENTKMKESRENDKEIRVLDYNITKNTNARSPLTFRNLIYAVA